jgi:putative flippase GtrA
MNAQIKIRGSAALTCSPVPSDAGAPLAVPIPARSRMRHGTTLPRYLLVGGTCALLGNSILIGFDLLGITYFVSSVVSFGVNVLLAYGLHTRWTFQTRRSFAGLIRYGAAMAINLPFSLALLFMLIDIGGLRMFVAAPLATVIQTAFNYLVATRLFRRTQSAADASRR